MATDITIKSGARAPEAGIQFEDGFGNPLNLPAGTTVLFRMRDADKKVPGWKVNAAAVIEDDDTAFPNSSDRSIVRYYWKAGDTDGGANHYYAEFVATLPDGRQLIEPSGGGTTYISVEVSEPLTEQAATSG